MTAYLLVVENETLRDEVERCIRIDLLCAEWALTATVEEMAAGACGIGLYRTEFLYVYRSEPPTEDQHYETYRRVLEAVAPLAVTLRTFDLGGDKFVSLLQLRRI